ncbi:MAG: Uma2 family endonuclease [Nitrospirae bacterium]|nr:Uma2 family endonuclease [Nitrospirota bacterium]
MLRSRCRKLPGVLSDSDKTIILVLYYFMDTTIGIERDFDLTEIINGEEVVTPSPLWIHQIIRDNLFRKIDRHVEQKGLGRLSSSPLDVIFEEGQLRLQPDLLFIRKENMPVVITDWVRIMPDMVCEIVSPGTYKRDTITKKEIYEKYGVPEYWVVIPALKIIEVLTIDEGKYKLYSYVEGEGVVTSKVIDGLQVNVKEIFE